MDKIRKKLAWVRSFRKSKSRYKKLKNSNSLQSLFPDNDQTYKRFSQPDLSVSNHIYKQTGKGRRRKLIRKHKKRRVHRIHRRKVHIRRRRKRIRY